jgi:hypothetical protein
MTDAWGSLHVEVWEDEIIVALPGTRPAERLYRLGIDSTALAETPFLVFTRSADTWGDSLVDVE